MGTPPNEDPKHSCSPQTWTPSTKAVVSVGCQTEDEAFFPEMQAGFSVLVCVFSSIFQSNYCL